MNDGEPLTLDCLTNVAPGVVIKWYLNGEQIPVNQSWRVYMKGSGNQLLVIEEVCLCYHKGSLDGGVRDRYRGLRSGYAPLKHPKFLSTTSNNSLDPRTLLDHYF